MRNILLLFCITLGFANISFAQEYELKMPDDIIFIDIKEFTDTPYIVTFYPSFISFIIPKREIPLIENDTCFQTAIMKTGSVFLNVCFFYSFLKYYCYFSESLKGRQDSLLFTSICKNINDECNSFNRKNIEYGLPLIANNQMVAKRIFHDKYLTGLIKISGLAKYGIVPKGQSSQMENLYLKFVIPYREENEWKELKDDN